MKHGSDAERAEILAELKPKLQELSKSPYGKFVVSKLIDTAPKAQLKGGGIPLGVCMARSPKGYVVKLNVWVWPRTSFWPD